MSQSKKKSNLERLTKTKKESCFEQDTLEGVEEVGAAGAEEAKIIGSRPLGNGLIAQVVRAHA